MELLLRVRASLFLRITDPNFWSSSSCIWTIKSNPYTSLDRPLGLQEVENPRISRQSACKGGPTHRPPLLPYRHPWYSCLLQAAWTPGPNSMKNPGNQPRALPACSASPTPMQHFCVFYSYEQEHEEIAQSDTRSWYFRLLKWCTLTRLGQ
jgi:hypothetical protein